VKARLMSEGEELVWGLGVAIYEGGPRRENQRVGLLEIKLARLVITLIRGRVSRKTYGL